MRTLGKFACVSVVVLASAALVSQAFADSKLAVPTLTFLRSIGVATTFPDRGQPLEKTIDMLRYGGFRWVRAGIEGLTDKGPTTVQTYLDLHRQTGVRLSLAIVGADISRLIETAKILANADALLAIEGNNEPNNWGLTYNGESGGGKAPSWMAVAKLQRDLYQAVKSDPILAKYPVWSISEPGAQRDNVGLQFLKIPAGANTLMPDGTTYADYANVHNYVYHPNSPHPQDNQVWNASDITASSKVDGLFGNFGVTWLRGFRGNTQEQLNMLPRVTTETGAVIGGKVSEQLHGLHLMNIYLAQFKQGYAHTSIYLLRDRTDERGHQTFGFFGPDYAPRKAALYLHNLTSVLQDNQSVATPGQLDYTLVNRPRTAHDLLLQRGDGTFQLVIWGERLVGEDLVTVRFDKTHPFITIYDPTVGTAPIAEVASASSVTLTLGDHPFVIFVLPASN